MIDTIRRQFFIMNDKLLNIKDFNPQIINHGETLYEVIKVKNCVPIFLEQYLERLKNSLKLTGHKLWFSFDKLIQSINLMIDKNCIVDEDHLKLVFSFNNDYFEEKQNIFLAYFVKTHLPSKSEYENGVKTITLYAQRLNPNAKIYQPKLKQKAEWLIQQNKIADVILLNPDNSITEGSKSNIFFIKNSTLITPQITDVLPGITRQNIIKLAKAIKLKVEERKVFLNELKDFDSAFLTGTSKKILPIRQIDYIYFDPKNKILRQLMKLYDLIIQHYIETHKHLSPPCSEC